VKMRCWIIMFAFISLFISQAYGQSIAVVDTKDSLSLRASPSKNATKIGSIKAGEKVEVVEKTAVEESIAGKTGVWCKIRSEGREGFVFGGYLNFLPQQASETHVSNLVGNITPIKEESVAPKEQVDFAQGANQLAHSYTQERQDKDNFEKLRIKPFGEFSWDDGLGDVFEKIKRINGIESVIVDFGRRRFNDLSIADLDVFDSKILAVLNNSTEDSRYYNELFTRCCTKLEGTSKTMSDFTCTIEAKPVLVCGIPLVLRIFFEVKPGFLIKFPAKTFKVSLPNGEVVYFPLVLRSVSLVAEKDVRAPKESIRKIQEMLTEKYKVYDHDYKNIPKNPEEWGGPGTEIEDAHFGSARFSVRPWNEGVDIDMSYSSEGVLKQLEDVYSKYIIDLNAEKNKSKKDMGSGL